MHTLDLIIRKHAFSTYQWAVLAGSEAIEVSVEEDIKSCLQAAAECFYEAEPVRLAVTYGGTQVGTYSSERLKHDAADVADGIMEMLTH